MMKKVWLILLAVVLVFGLAMLGCGQHSAPEEEEEGDEGVLDKTIPLNLKFDKIESATTKGWVSNGVDNITTKYEFADFKDAKYLVLELSKKPEKDIGIIWNADVDWKWNQNDDVFKDGVPNAAKGAKIREEADGKCVVQFELAKAMINRNKLPKCTKIILYVSTFNTTGGVDGLGITEAYLEIWKGGKVEPSSIKAVTVSPATADVVRGKSQVIKAEVTGELDFDDTVEWSVGGIKQNSSTFIVPSGLSVRLFVAANEKVGTKITVTATSKQDDKKKGTATVTVIDANDLPLADGIFELGAPDGDWWYSNGADGKETDLTMDILKSAKYLILKMKAEALGGMNGGLAIQADYDWTGWNEAQVAWSELGDTTLGAEGAKAVYYIVIDLSKCKNWDKLIGTNGTQAKIKVNYGFGDLVGGYLSSVTLEKPTDAVEIEWETGKEADGWFAPTVDEMYE